MQKVVILNVTTSGVYTVGVVTSDEQKTVKSMTLDERTLISCLKETGAVLINASVTPSGIKDSYGSFKRLSNSAVVLSTVYRDSKNNTIGYQVVSRKDGTVSRVKASELYALCDKAQKNGSMFVHNAIFRNGFLAEYVANSVPKVVYDTSKTRSSSRENTPDNVALTPKTILSGSIFKTNSPAVKLSYEDYANITVSLIQPLKEIIQKEKKYTDKCLRAIGNAYRWVLVYGKTYGEDKMTTLAREISKEIPEVNKPILDIWALDKYCPELRLYAGNK